MKKMMYRGKLRRDYMGEPCIDCGKPSEYHTVRRCKSCKSAFTKRYTKAKSEARKGFKLQTSMEREEAKAIATARINSEMKIIQDAGFDPISTPINKLPDRIREQLNIRLGG